MAFLRIVEVIPPLFPVSENLADPISLEPKIERFTEEVRSIRDFADLFLIANVKDPRMLKIETVHIATMLQEFLNVQAAPVIVVRDHRRAQFLSTILGALAARLKSLMLVWGDDLPASIERTDASGYSGLADAIAEASVIRSRARAPTRFLAPVDIESLSRSKGIRMAKGRLRAGAEILLAQPPTTDPGKTFDRHLSLIEEAGLKDKVILSVFPFKDDKDAKRYEKMFGWKLPKSLHEGALRGSEFLLERNREIVRRSEAVGLPGIYLSTRGEPALAERVLS